MEEKKQIINEELYKLVCGKRFDKIDEAIKDIAGLLRGENDKPGLVEEVRSLKKFNKGVIGSVGFVVCVIVAQIINWISGWLRAR